jgi:hypothetical protein
LLACVLIVPAFAGCPCRSYDRSYAAPGLDELLGHLEARRAALRSYQTDSVMDYWIGKDRFRGEVLVMGTTGARVRMNALSPAGGSVAADLACDGVNFVYVDQLNNCVLTGPCTAESIAQLLRVPLEPDDFLYLALGATPVIEGAQGTVTWSSKSGREVLRLTGAGGMQQTVELDGRDGQKTWDVLKSEVRAPDGKVIWTVEHKGYRAVTGEDGTPYRVPGKSQIRTPQEKSDLLVEWGDDREINLELVDDKFDLAPPDVPRCGSQAKGP